MFLSIVEINKIQIFSRTTHYRIQQGDAHSCSNANQSPYGHKTILCQSLPLARWLVIDCSLDPLASDRSQLTSRLIHTGPICNSYLHEAEVKQCHLKSISKTLGFMMSRCRAYTSCGEHRLYLKHINSFLYTPTYYPNIQKKLYSWIQIC